MIRLLDFLFSLFGLLILSPLFIIISCWVKFSSNGPVIYRQRRVGRFGKDFWLYKFRSMRVDADKSGLLTVGGRDPRITNAGIFLRKYKLDELPQLFNVLLGDMSLVGPRPEVRKYVELYTPQQQKVLNVRPGITDLASIEFKNENEILARSGNPELTYISEIMPEKIRLNQTFINSPTVTNYIRIIFRTVFG